MLPEPILVAIDRLVAAMMVLVDAAGDAFKGTIPTLDYDAALALLDRASTLVIRLITISNFGLPETKPATSLPTPGATSSPSLTPRAHAGSFLRRRGWLLEALPDTAPALADDLQGLLQDPDVVAFLASAPGIHRTLRPLLRSLALDHPKPRTPPTPKPPAPPPPPPPKPNTRRWEETYRTPTVTIPGLTLPSPPPKPFPWRSQTRDNFISISKQYGRANPLSLIATRQNRHGAPDASPSPPTAKSARRQAKTQISRAHAIATAARAQPSIGNARVGMVRRWSAYRHSNAKGAFSVL